MWRQGQRLRRPESSSHLESFQVHDPRLTWNTLDIVEEEGGDAVQNKSGHSFIKEKMREIDGVHGGEMSAHHWTGTKSAVGN